MDDPLNLENRRRIYGFIESNPGIHLREIQRALDMQPGLLSYHLDYLEKRNLIKSEDDGNRKRYFVADRFRLKDRRIISLLRQRSPSEIIVHLLIKGPSSFTEIRNALGISKSTLSYHMKKLTRYGIVICGTREREKIYWLKKPEEVIDLIISLKPAAESTPVDRFAEIWELLAKR